MDNQKKGHFKDDIKKILAIHALIPILLITLVFVVIIFIFWTQSITYQNKYTVTNLLEQLDTIIPSYTAECGCIAQDYDWERIKTDNKYAVSFSEDLYDFINNQSLRANFFAFDNSLNITYSTTSKVPEFLENIPGISWGIFNKMHRTPGETVMDFYFYQTNEGKIVELQIGQEIVQHGSTVGYVVFTMTNEDFLRKISNLPAQVVVTDRYDRICMATNYEFHNQVDKVNQVLRNATGYLNYNKKHYYINKTFTDNGDLCIYAITDTGNMRTTLMVVGFLIVMVLVVLIVGIFISAHTISVQKTKIIDVMVDAFNCVQKGQLDTCLNISTNDEFEIIGDAYNLMLESIKSLIHRNDIQVRETTLSQIKQLESQFNPHFLFNTLENVRFMVRMNPLVADKMIVCLSNLLRYSIQNNNDAVTVRDDVNYTQNYLTILTYRFGDRFHYKLNIQKETEECIIPRLIFQPLIENAVKYGFGDRENLTVQIKARFLGDDLIIIIYDDGVGIQPKLLAKINKNLRNTSNKTNHIGLHNVNRRITLMYGEEYGLEVKSQQGAGTVVRLRLPTGQKMNKLSQNSPAALPDTE